MRNGIGSKRLADGTRYKGRWLNNKPHGHGVKKWPTDNAMYEGEWENGKHHGHGVKTYNDGTRYEGGWYYGKPHGISLLRESHGRIFQIDFAYGKFVRLCDMWASDRDYQSGQAQKVLEERLAQEMWKKMTLEQLENAGMSDEEDAGDAGEGVDHLDDEDTLAAMPGEADGGTMSARSRAESIASRVSQMSQRLLDMGFSQEAADKAAAESARRQMAGAGLDGGGGSGTKK